MPSTDQQTDYVDHPLLEPGFIERRLYQLQLAGTAKNDHTLVTLPTGLGKTTVSLLVTAERLAERRSDGPAEPPGGSSGGKALLLAPTKPLVDQHAGFYRDAIAFPDTGERGSPSNQNSPGSDDDDDVVVFTGEVSPEDRAALWETASVVVATPQVVENDLVGGRIGLESVVHLTFDECHRATGDYAYNYIAERYHQDAEDPLVTGMSASPGGDEEEILTVCENLGIREVEVMTEEDSDVGEYTHDTDVEWERVTVPDEVMEIRDLLNEVITERLERLKQLGVVNSTQPDMSQKDLNEVRGRLQELIDNDQSEGYKGMSAHAEVMKLRQAVTLVETQSVAAVEEYFERQRNAARSSGASKATQRMVSESRVRTAMRKAAEYDDVHPKFRRAHTFVAETLVSGGERVIVFTESRDTAEMLTEFFDDDFDARRFVGQGDREGSEGMTQTQQREVLASFRDGEFEVLVSTSVAEEGLDVPEVDLVLFYEPVPTAIRSIQRKGRTGRQDEGRVVVLLAEDTRDEAYFWISKRREDEMEQELRKLKGFADEVEAELDDSQRRLGEFAGGGGETDDSTPADGRPGLRAFGRDVETDAADEDPDGVVATARGSDSAERRSADSSSGRGPREGSIEIVADQRELDASIARDLSTREGVETRLETLAVGDYVLSDRVAVERKSVSDFLDTLTGGDRSVFEQVGDMTRHYARPVLVVEGEGLYEERNVHPNAIRGALASLAVDFGASVLRTRDEDDTADLLEVVAEREQAVADRQVSVHGEKSAKTTAEQQEYVVASIADIGPVTARSLLAEFGTVEAVMTARKDDLLEADGVGEVTADRIREVVGSEYEP